MPQLLNWSRTARVGAGTRTQLFEQTRRELFTPSSRYECVLRWMNSGAHQFFIRPITGGIYCSCGTRCTMPSACDLHERPESGNLFVSFPIALSAGMPNSSKGQLYAQVVNIALTGFNSRF